MTMRRRRSVAPLTRLAVLLALLTIVFTLTATKTATAVVTANDNNVASSEESSSAQAAESTNDDDVSEAASGEKESTVAAAAAVERGEGGGKKKGRLAAAHAAADEDGKVGQSSSLTNDNDNNQGESASSSSSSSYNNDDDTHNDPEITSDSVILITGAAGFIGSELALALLRTYNVHKLLLVDDLGIDSENESAFVPPPPPKEGSSSTTIDNSQRKKAIYEILTEDGLGQFEMKRQRAFRIFYELTSANRKYNHQHPQTTGLADKNEQQGGSSSSSSNNVDNAEATRFYRADMRPSIPEFFDFGEIPLLEGIFQSHPDITHVVHLAGECFFQDYDR